MGKMISRTLGALMMIIAIVITQIPVSDVEAVDAASASDFQMDGTTLVKYNGTAEDVSIGDTVEKIEAEAFAGNDYVKTVTIGKSVKSINAGAFEGCSQLTTVKIPDSVETIEQAAFADCPSLISVGIGSGLNSLGNGVFAGDTSLERINISSNNSNFIFDDGAIYNKNGKDTLYVFVSGRKDKSYSIPSTVRKIKPYAFWGDRNLESISISGNVAEISAYAFSNCANLKNVDIPYSVNTIGLKAFENCIRLRNITIPISVNSIHSTAFDGCTRLTIEAEEGSAAKTFADNLVLEDIEVTEYEDTPIDTVNDIDTESDEESEDEAEEPLVVDYYHEVTHMNPLEAEEDGTVKGVSKIIGSQVFVFMDNASATVNSGVPDMEHAEGIDYGETGETIASISTGMDEKGGSFPKYTIVDDTIIANQAYYNDDRTEITIPDTITEIGEFAFARSGLTVAAIPESVTKIGYAAFYHCDGLTEVVIPDTVTEIAPSAFDNTLWLRNWEQNGNGDFLIVGDHILLDYRGSNSIVTIPDGVKTIGAGAFKNHTGLTRIILPDSVEVIGEDAFLGCNNLSSIEGGNYVRQIKDRAFAGCPLQEIRIPASVEEIGLRAFDVADSVKMSKTGKVVFEGSSLPKLSYEASSGKLYNDSYRGLAFAGVSTAIVPEQAETAGTVLDGKLSGFRGVIRTAGGNSQVEIDEENLVAEGSADSDMGVDAADSDADTADVSSGSDADTTNTVSDTNEDAAAAVPSNLGVIVRISSNFIDNDGFTDAVLDGAEDSYILKIVDSEGAKASILESYQRLYGNNVPSNLQAYEITLQEEKSSIPITGLGRQKIEITIPFPSGISEENLHVVCLDANGQLEEADSWVRAVDGMSCITFTTNHFSPYAIYNYTSTSTSGDMAAVRDGKAVFTSLSGNKDASPDTGDYSIHPKWFLAIGLLFTGLGLFFYRGKRQII